MEQGTPFDLSPMRIGYLITHANQLKADLIARRRLCGEVVSAEVEKRFQDALNVLNDSLFKLETIYASFGSHPNKTGYPDLP